MAQTTQNKVFLFLTYLSKQPKKNQLIWLHCLGKINEKINNQSIPVYEVLHKTSTSLKMFKQIVSIGNQYLQSINFAYKFNVEDENLLIIKVEVPKKAPIVRQPKTDKHQLKLMKHQSMIDEIIDYLNYYAGETHSSETKIFTDTIIARIEEGYLFKDFKHVIEVKTNQWFNSDKMKQHLNPKTLFGDKMEVYVLEKINVKQSKLDKNAAELEKAKTHLFSANPESGND